MGRGLLLLLILTAQSANANTVFVNGTEFCGTAKDSSELLRKHAPNSVSFISQNCARGRDDLPRKGMEESLTSSAANCEKAVGPERWRKFVARWNEAYASFPSFADSKRRPEEDPFVGAFCEGVMRSKPGETFTFHKHAHGIASKARSLAFKSGEFHLDHHPYPGAALWAALALVPDDRRFVGLHENCYGESLMSDMMFGPYKNFDQYRPGTCAVAAAAHDRFHYSQYSVKTERQPTPAGDACRTVKIPLKQEGTFMRGVDAMPADPAPSLAAYERTLISRAKNALNLPITSSASALGLYFDLNDKSRVAPGDVNLASCALNRGFKIPFLAEIGARARFDEESTRLSNEFHRVYAQIFGKKPSEKINISSAEKQLAELEGSSAEAPINQAYAKVNVALAEIDKRNADFELVCEPTAVPPACKTSEDMCTVKQLRENCIAMRSDIYKEACRKLEADPRVTDSTPISKLLPKASCKSRDLDCLSKKDIEAETSARVKKFRELNAKSESLRYLARLGKSINALDLMVTDLASTDAARATQAQQAMRAYLGMLECEKGRMYE